MRGISITSLMKFAHSCSFNLPSGQELGYKKVSYWLEIYHNRHIAQKEAHFKVDAAAQYNKNTM